MKNIIRLVTILLLCTNPLRAQHAWIEADSSEVELRRFSDSRLDEIRADDAFDYTVSTNPAGASLWQRFTNWLRSIFMPLFEIEWGGFRVGKFLLYLIMITGLSVAIFRLIKMRSRQIFQQQQKSALEYEISDENIHTIDFDKLLKEAVDTRQFKRAIRLTYLHALKLLSDAEKIHWQPGKTNLEYAGEIAEGSLREHFIKLGYFFDYAWYGEFDVKENHFQSARNVFRDFRREGRL